MDKLKYLYYLKRQQQKKVNDVFEDTRQKLDAKTSTLKN